MKTLTRSLLLLSLFGIVISDDARSQERRLLVLSPRVGPVIDSTEREYFDLFRTIRDFHSASVYQTPGDTFLVIAKRMGGGIFLPDSIFSIPRSLLDYAESIEHRETLLRGTHVPGSRSIMITYEDGTPLQFPAMGRMAEQKALRLTRNDTVTTFPNGRLPLAQNTSGLYRPMFHTTHFAFSFGGLVTDFSSLSPLNVDVSNVCLPVAFYIEVPLAEDPLISLIGRWGFALGGASGGSLLTFSAGMLYRTGTSTFSPIVGIGAASTWYGYSRVSSSNSSSSNTNLDINAASTYGMLIAGICLQPNSLDLLCSLPLRSSLHTVFEKKAYTITPAVFEVSLLMSL